MKRHLTTIILMTVLLAVPASTWAQNNDGEPTTEATTGTHGVVIPTKYQPPKKDKVPLFAGFAVGADLLGPALLAFGSSYYQLEVLGRLNLKEKFFPVFQFGLGRCTREGKELPNTFHTSAPYFRAGLDYNLNKKVNGNRFMVGFRYGFSSYKYDFDTDSYSDPVWNETEDHKIHDMRGSLHWIELCVGFETKIWSFIRLGYTASLRGRISQGFDDRGEPWYVPGFGINGSTCFGGTINLMFDFGKTMRSNKKKDKNKE